MHTTENSLSGTLLHEYKYGEAFQVSIAIFKVGQNLMVALLRFEVHSEITNEHIHMVTKISIIRPSIDSMTVWHTDS